MTVLGGSASISHADMGAAEIAGNAQRYLDRATPFSETPPPMPTRQVGVICLSRIFRYDAELEQWLSQRISNALASLPAEASAVETARQAAASLEITFRKSARPLLDLEWRGCWAEYGWNVDPVKTTPDP
jgi:hypothetical protein